MVVSRQKEVWNRDYALLLLNDSKGSLYITSPYRQKSTLEVFAQFGALYMMTGRVTRPNKTEWAMGAGQVNYDLVVAWQRYPSFDLVGFQY